MKRKHIILKRSAARLKCRVDNANSKCTEVKAQRRTLKCKGLVVKSNLKSSNPKILAAPLPDP